MALKKLDKMAVVTCVFCRKLQLDCCSIQCHAAAKSTMKSFQELAQKMRPS